MAAQGRRRCLWPLRSGCHGVRSASRQTPLRPSRAARAPRQGDRRHPSGSGLSLRRSASAMPQAIAFRSRRVSAAARPRAGSTSRWWLHPAMLRRHRWCLSMRSSCWRISADKGRRGEHLPCLNAPSANTNVMLAGYGWADRLLQQKPLSHAAQCRARHPQGATRVSGRWPGGEVTSTSSTRAGASAQSSRAAVR